jgi:hypothetical protein
MLEVLKEAEAVLPELLAHEESWRGVFADSEKPHLQRLWRQWGEYRIYLHHFSACEPKEEFPHPHPWRMAVRILEGEYVMGVGHSSDPKVVPGLTHRVFHPGDSYELIHASEWHAIRPLKTKSLSLMVAGPVVYPQNRIRSNKVARELTDIERTKLFAKVRKHYPKYCLPDEYFIIDLH